MKITSLGKSHHGKSLDVQMIGQRKEKERREGGGEKGRKEKGKGEGKEVRRKEG